MQGFKSGAARAQAVEENISLVRLFRRTLTEDTSTLTIDLSGIDMSQYLELELRIFDAKGADDSAALYTYIKINGDNTSGDYLYVPTTYSPTDAYASTTVGFYAPVKNAVSHRVVRLFSGMGYVLMRTDVIACNGSKMEAQSNRTSAMTYGAWLNGGMSDIETLTLSSGTSNPIKAGAGVALYGWKK